MNGLQPARASESTEMSFRVGVDVQSIARFRQMDSDVKQGLKERVFTAEERAYCERTRYPAQRYAGRWAVKEAFVKLLESPASVSFDSIAVKRDGARPWLEIEGSAVRALETEFETSTDRVAFDVSLSHDREADTAIAQVIATAKPR